MDKKIKNGSSLATKNDVNNIVTEAVDAVLEGVERMFDEKLKTKADKTDIERVEKRLDKVEANIGFIKDDIKGIKADLSTKVSISSLPH